MIKRASCSGFFGIVILTIGLVYPLAGSASMAEKSMDMIELAPPRTVPAAVLIGYWTKQKVKRALSPDEGVILRLAEFSQSIGIKSFAVSHSDKTDEAASAVVTREMIASSLEDHVRSQRPWDSPIPAGALAVLKRERADFRDMVGADRFAWAWALNQLGEKAESRKLLSSLFDREYARVMKAHQTFSREVREAEALSTPLKQMSSKAEAAAIDAKLQQMKLHLSNLPNYEIMT